jgi:hypothetical protein
MFAKCSKIRKLLIASITTAKGNGWGQMLLSSQTRNSHL